MPGHPRLLQSDKQVVDDERARGSVCVNNNNIRPLDAMATLIMLAVTLSWGLNQVSIKLALPEIPPLIQATVRSTGAFALIALWARWRGVSFTLRDGTLAGGLIAGALFG